ncbi:unnamed protein product [Soboliphyme baturini]|uniref:G protein-coupled receptor n=1 Tax=Soboliphyme baturini TaxID=241478 RepID=A0A183IRR8_9BILA|nr:unnamed protein product [Soboliphyme baturini]
MHMCGHFFVITDESTKIGSFNLPNRTVVIVMTVLQSAVLMVSLAQHVYSLLHVNSIFDCHFNASLSPPSNDLFMTVDVVVYDYGFFHLLLGTEKCVANYLDGGYMRFTWCLMHAISQLLVFRVACGNAVLPLLMQPAVFMQSIYSLGLIILALATIPQLLSAFIDAFTANLVYLTAIYYSGTAANWFFTFVLWHYFWNIKKTKKLLRGSPV